MVGKKSAAAQSGQPLKSILKTSQEQSDKPNKEEEQEKEEASTSEEESEDEDVAEPESTSLVPPKSAPKQRQNDKTFSDFHLDPRLLTGLAKLKHIVPTPVQQKAIPPLLAGKDVLAHARTGSGKTAAYLLPILHACLRQPAAPAYQLVEESSAGVDHQVRAVILVPTKELVYQIMAFTKKCLKFADTAVVPMQLTNEAKQLLPVVKPHVLIATPAVLVKALATFPTLLNKLQTLVLDEADLMLSFGYQGDVKEIKEALPRTYQTVLMSATLSEDLDFLTSLILHEPVRISLAETQQENILKQLSIQCTKEERYLFLYILLRLKLPLRSKTLIFCNAIDTAYRIKLYLEQYSLKSCVLNAELPVNSRYHTVQEFNRGVMNIMIATDAGQVNTSSLPSEKGAKKARQTDSEYGVSRGIDFRAVATVINFDLPESTDNYTHRIGRTARGHANGLAVTFVPSKMEKTDAGVWDKIVDSQRGLGFTIEPYTIPNEAVEALKYRANDALRSVTTLLVRQARLEELKQEMLNSEKLKTFFEEHPQDMNTLRHDHTSASGRKVSGGALKTLPKYLVNDTAAAASKFAISTRPSRGRFHRGRKTQGIKRKVDPLKNLSFHNKRKK